MPEETVKHRAMITACATGATVLQSLDQTIANVALPYMQGSFSASGRNHLGPHILHYRGGDHDRAGGLVGGTLRLQEAISRRHHWLHGQFDAVRGSPSQQLGQIVSFRLLQGMFSAALVPLSQATLLDIYPNERRGFAMAIWGMGVMLGPIMGPTLGGWLTETYNWRFVFYINLPFGLAAIAGLLIFLPGSSGQGRLRFDWMGFGMLTTGIGALQLMLDPGPGPGLVQFQRNREPEAVLAGSRDYLFLIHMVLRAPVPLIRPVVFERCELYLRPRR